MEPTEDQSLLFGCMTPDGGGATRRLTCSAVVWLPDSQLRPNARVVRPSSVGWSQGDLRGAISAATAMSRATADEAKKAHRWERRPWHRAERADRVYLVIKEQ